MKQKIVRYNRTTITYQRSNNIVNVNIFILTWKNTLTSRITVYNKQKNKFLHSISYYSITPNNHYNTVIFKELLH